MKRKLFALLTMSVLICTLILPPGHSSATFFDPNRIMDDAVFDRVGSMSVGQINTFLNQFGSSCISTNHGFSAPDPTGYSPSSGYLYGGNVSAGQVIYDAAQAYGINPQVLLTTLQKEQSLVTGGGGCSTLAYAAAVGYGCPDGGTTYSYSGVNLYTINGTTVTSVSGTCVNSSLKVGFSQQVIRAAWLLRFGEQRSKGNVGWAVINGNWNNSDDPQSCYYGPMTQGTWQNCPNNPAAYYDGSDTIDGTAIHIDTGATAALYWYTPHFSGNQNFVNIFVGWFGSQYATSSNINWSFEKLDGNGSTVTGASTTDQVGNYPTTIAANGVIHIFYYDISTGALKHAWNDTNGWHYEVVDGPGGVATGQVNDQVGGFTKAVVWNNQLYIAYHDFTNGTLRLAVQSGTAWTTQTLDGAGGGGGRYSADVGWDISLMANGGGMHLFYSDASNGNLRHAWNDGSGWRFENLDGDWGSIARHDGNIGQGVTGQFIGNDIHLFYYDGSRGSLRHAFANNTGWHFEDLDGMPTALSHFADNLGTSPGFAYYNGSFQLFYHDNQRALMRHAFTNNTGWHFEDLDGSPTSLSHYLSDVGRRNTLVVPTSTALNVFYYDATHRAMREAYADGAGWHFCNIDGTPDASSGSPYPIGEMMTATLLGSQTQMYYFNPNTMSLVHAWGQ